MKNFIASLVLAVLIFTASFTSAQNFITQSIPSDGKSSIGFNYYRLNPFEKFGDVDWHGIYELDASLVLDKWVVGSSFSFIRTHWPQQRLSNYFFRIGGSFNGDWIDYENSAFANVGLKIGRMLGKQNNQMLSLNFFIPTSDNYEIEDGILVNYLRENNAYNMGRYSFHSFMLQLNYSFELDTKSNWLIGGELGGQIFMPKGSIQNNSFFNYAVKAGYKFNWFTVLAEAGGLADIDILDNNLHFINTGIQLTKYKFQPGIFYTHNLFSPKFNNVISNSNSLGIQLIYKF